MLYLCFMKEITTDDSISVTNYYLITCQRLSHSIEYSPEYVLVKAETKEQAYSKAHKAYGKGYIFNINNIE